MKNLEVYDSGLRITMEPKGNGPIATFFLSVLVAIGVISILMTLGISSDPTEMLVFIPFGLFLIIFPLWALIYNTPAKVAKRWPYLFDFDNHTQTLKIYEDRDSPVPEFSLPFASIEGFILDSYTTTSSSTTNAGPEGTTISHNSTTTWYVASMVKKDGALWEFFTSARKKDVEDYLDLLNTNIHLQAGDAYEAGESLVPSTTQDFRRIILPDGQGLAWHVTASYVPPAIFLILGLGALALVGLDPSGLIVGIVGFFLLIAALGSITRAVTTNISDQAILIKFGMVVRGTIYPRQDGTFLPKKSKSTMEAHAIVYDWNQRSGSFPRDILVLNTQAWEARQNRLSLGEPTSIAQALELAKLAMAAQKGTLRIPIQGYKLTQILALEAMIQETLAQLGDPAL